MLQVSEEGCRAVLDRVGVVTNNLYALSHPTCPSLSLSLSVVIGSSPGCYGAYPALLSRQSRRGGRERSDGLETAGAAKSDLASAIALA